MERLSARNREDQLYALAEEQGGYFTSADAKSTGYDYPLQYFHIQRGNWIRVDRAVYRLKHFPTVDHEDLIRWWLWSRKQGVISHQSAVAVYDLGDVLPTRVHITVPLNFRKKPAPGLMLHKENLDTSDIEIRDRFPVTVPLRTILDLAREHLDPEGLTLVVKDALRKGLVDRKALLSVLEKVPKWLDSATQVTLQLALREG